jgi:alpha-mannosidase
MPIRRVSLILPCPGWDDFPTHLGDEASAELLSGWTALWHPAILAAAERIPGWHPAGEPPDPAALEGELVVVPPPSRERMPSDWCDRLRATAPANPQPVDGANSFTSRQETIAAVLSAAELDPNSASPDSAADFLALGFAYLQVELLTRAMRYSSVLDTDNFESASVAAAKAAVAGNRDNEREELSRAFDLLADARNHVYSVDFYVVDVTLIADSTLGEPLRAKLAMQVATSLLIAGEQIDRMAKEHPETLAELKRAIEAGTASVVGGRYNCSASQHESPEGLLAGLRRGQLAAQINLGREYEVFGQYESAFVPLLPQVLKGLGFRGALHAAFDGGQLPRAEQRKTNWGPDSSRSIEALSATPLDASRPETWLKFAERIADSIARDHVATIVLAGWPGAECEYFDDLRRAAQYGSVLGKLVTLDEYFRVTREVDDWTKFNPRDYPSPADAGNVANTISSQVDAYRSGVRSTHRQLGEGLAVVAGLKTSDGVQNTSDRFVGINPWNSPSTLFVGIDPLNSNDQPAASAGGESKFFLPDVLGCGYAALKPQLAAPLVALAEDRTLRNERVELTVSNKTGGIQSLRTHRDRGTRVSQRLVFHDESGAAQDLQMVADRVELSRNDEWIGEITSLGRLLGAKNKVLARFTQRVRVARGLAPAIVEVELEPQQMPEGDVWKSYFASRLAWADEALSVRRGDNWVARATERERIESPEWIEVDDVIGRVTCFALGLPLHRRAAPNWLDTLLLVAGEERRRFQFAIGIDNVFPAQAAVALLTAGQPCVAEMPWPLSVPHGWFLHIATKNLLLTHMEPLPAPLTGIRARLLETEGRETRTTLAAFRPFTSARCTDFRGTEIEVLSVFDGRVEFDIGPHRWMQIECEFCP